MEAKKDFADLRTSVATTQQHQQQLQLQEASLDQVSTPTSFLQELYEAIKKSECFE